MARPALSEEENERTRSALLDVAQRLYESGGAGAMSFRAIAEGYGCSNTMPYSYFGSKADIVDGLRIRAYEWMHDVLSAAADQAPDALAALQALAMSYVRARTDRPRMYELLYASGGAMDERDPALLAAKRDALGVCQRVIEAAAESAEVSLTTDAETAAHLFWVAAHGLVSLDAGGFLVVGRTAEELLPTLFRVMTRGVTQPEGGTA